MPFMPMMRFGHLRFAPKDVSFVVVAFSCCVRMVFLWLVLWMASGMDWWENVNEGCIVTNARPVKMGKDEAIARLGGVSIFRIVLESSADIIFV